MPYINYISKSYFFSLVRRKIIEEMRMLLQNIPLFTFTREV